MQILEILKHFYTLSNVDISQFIIYIYIQILLHNTNYGIKVSKKSVILQSPSTENDIGAFLGKMNVNIKIISCENTQNAAQSFIKAFGVLAASVSILLWSQIQHSDVTHLLSVISALRRCQLFSLPSVITIWLLYSVFSSKKFLPAIPKALEINEENGIKKY